MRAQDPPADDCSKLIVPKSYADATSQLTRQAGEYALRSGLDFKRSFLITLAAPDNKLLAQKYLSESWHLKRT
jgi:hypothetical protein